MKSTIEISNIPLPEEWAIYNRRPKWIVSYWFSNCFGLKKVIMITPPKWIPTFIRGRIVDIAINHEIMHAWDIKSCENRKCLWNMYWDTGLIGKFTTVLSNLKIFNFCSYHSEKLHEIIS